MDPNKMKVAELQAELRRRGASAKGLKADLIIRLQAKLDEEEFGMPGAIEGIIPTTESSDSPLKKEEAKKDVPSTAEVEVPAVSAAPKPAVVVEEEKAPPQVEPDEKKEEAPKPVAAVEATSQPQSKVEEKKVIEVPTPTDELSFAEKKRLRALRFGVPIVSTTNPEKKKKIEINKAKRLGEVVTKTDIEEVESKNKNDKGKRSKQQGNESSSPKKQKIEAKVSDEFEGLSKEELEKRLDRAIKFNLGHAATDKIKIALRKFRFS